MQALPDFDAIALARGMMFEKAKPINASPGAAGGGLTAEERARLRVAANGGGDERFVSRSARRAGDALRAVEWSEITARLNAARDLRLLLRNESQAPIEAVAASFGDAAASYFALLEDSEPHVNPDALGQPKALGANVGSSDAIRPRDAAGPRSDAPRGDARDRQ
jgi:hypothetical protein